MIQYPSSADSHDTMPTFVSAKDTPKDGDNGKKDELDPPAVSKSSSLVNRTPRVKKGVEQGTYVNPSLLSPQEVETLSPNDGDNSPTVSNSWSPVNRSPQKGVEQSTYVNSSLLSSEEVAAIAAKFTANLKTTDVEPCLSEPRVDEPCVSGSRIDEHCVPEGQWGWMVVVSIFVLLMSYKGHVFSLGVFLVEFMDYFDASATEISWAISLGRALSGSCSPFAGALCTRFGSRRVALVGSAICFTGVLLASFSQTVTHLYITLGVMVGTGAALVWSPTLVMLGHYFHKRYVLANSIAFCGYSLAQMVIPRLMQTLTEEYGWRGAMLIQSAMIANMFVTSSLLRPRSSPPPRNQSTDKLRTRPSFSHYHEEPNPKSDVTDQVLNQESKEIWTSTTSLHMFDNILTSPKSTTVLFHEDSNQPRTNLLLTIGAYIRRFIRFWQHTYGLSSLIRSPLYMITVGCSLTAGLGWFVTGIHLVARAIKAGISPDNAALLVTIIGSGSFVGRAGHGVLIDKKVISRQVMFTVAFGATGVLSLLNPIMDSFPLLCVYSVLFGFSHGIANSLVFAMMKLQVSSHMAAAALSFGTLVLAISNTLGGVIAGILYDATGGYDNPFYFAGVSILSGTLVLSIVFLINYWRKDQVNLQTRRRSLFLRSQIFTQ